MAHRGWRGLARCAWPHALWITGDGPFAVVAPCGTGTTVSLWTEPEAALDSLDWISRYGCGSRCDPNRHHLAQLAAESPTPLPDREARR